MAKPAKPARKPRLSPAEQARIAEIFRFITSRNISVARTRFHGDYHLGQALWTGRDFVIIDFEGEPARPISARRIKASPLRDTASMIRSFHYAVHRGLRKAVQAPDVLSRLEKFAEHWFQWSSSAFLRSYLRTAGDAPFVPKEREELSGLLDVFLLEKAIYELGYELDHRPDWLSSASKDRSIAPYLRAGVIFVPASLAPGPRTNLRCLPRGCIGYRH